MEAVDIISTMHELEKVAKNYQGNMTSGRIFPESKSYFPYVIIEILVDELMRNLGLSLASIFVTTLFLLFNCFLSVLVALSVVMTLRRKRNSCRKG